MKKAINKNLKNYKALEDLRKPFREDVMKETSWKRATFFNRLSGSQPPSPLEQKCLDAHFEKYTLILTQIKKHA
jgi:hypothetical protein